MLMGQHPGGISTQSKSPGNMSSPQSAGPASRRREKCVIIGFLPICSVPDPDTSAVLVWPRLHKEAFPAQPQRVEVDLDHLFHGKCVISSFPARRKVSCQGHMKGSRAHLSTCVAEFPESLETCHGACPQTSTHGRPCKQASCCGPWLLPSPLLELLCSTTGAPVPRWGTTPYWDSCPVLHAPWDTLAAEIRLVVPHSVRWG